MSTELFVNGPLMRGLKLNPNLDGATFLGGFRTAPKYRNFPIRARTSLIRGSVGRGFPPTPSRDPAGLRAPPSGGHPNPAPRPGPPPRPPKRGQGRVRPAAGDLRIGGKPVAHAIVVLHPEGAEPNARVLRDQLDCLVHVPGLEHAESAQLLLGFGVRPIGHHRLAALPAQRLGGSRALQRLPAPPTVTVLPKPVVVGDSAFLVNKGEAPIPPQKPVDGGRHPLLKAREKAPDATQQATKQVEKQYSDWAKKYAV